MSPPTVVIWKQEELGIDIVSFRLQSVDLQCTLTCAAVDYRKAKRTSIACQYEPTTSKYLENPLAGRVPQAMFT
jgi:hypothetical protein